LTERTDSPRWGLPLVHNIRDGIIFRIKILNKLEKNYPILDIDVASMTYKLGDKKLAAYNLTRNDFKEEDEYYEFPLDFRVANEEQLVEFRIFSCEIGEDEKKE
jgi:hypothetical protein